MTFIFLSINKIIMQIHIAGKKPADCDDPITYELINTSKCLLHPAL